METWFIADCHFFHDNIVKYKRTQFDSVYDMNKLIIDNWNACVKPKDEVYILGDFSFGTGIQTEEILKQLKGKKYLLIGNHDLWKKSARCARHLIWMKDYFELKENNNLWILSHYPFYSWNKRHHGSIHIHGHTHEKVNLTIDGEDWMGTDKTLFNRFQCASVDVTGFAPISMTQLKKQFHMKQR